MKLNIKAALLSAFVLPGLGQLKNGRRAKGGVLLLLSNVFLIGAVFVVLRGLGPVLVKAKITGVVDANAVAETMASGGRLPWGCSPFLPPSGAMPSSTPCSTGATKRMRTVNCFDI